MRKPEIVIKTDGPRTKIFVDGKKLEGVKGYRLTQDVRENNSLPVLQIDLAATNLTLETECIPELPDMYKPFYCIKHTDQYSSSGADA